MPQIEQILTTYASQFFWLAIAFALIFFPVGLGLLPKVQATVDQRDKQIADDLAAAERARASADEAEEAHRARTEANRAEAQKLIQAAKDAAARDAEGRIKAADAELDRKSAAAEESLRAQTQSALAEIETIAADAAQEMVARLAGATVSREQAQAAVKAALHHG